MSLGSATIIIISLDSTVISRGQYFPSLANNIHSLRPSDHPSPASERVGSHSTGLAREQEESERDNNNDNNNNNNSNNRRTGHLICTPIDRRRVRGRSVCSVRSYVAWNGGISCICGGHSLHLSRQIHGCISNPRLRLYPVHGCISNLRLRVYPI